MSDSEYRAFVVSFVDELTPEEVYNIALVYGIKNVDIKSFGLAGLGLFASLESLGIFSQSRAEGLIDVAKSINRYDLVRKVEAFIQHPKKGDSYGTSKKKPEERGKKNASSPSKEFQLLEQAFETMNRQVEVLRRQINQLQSTLQKSDGEAVEGGKEIVHYSGDIAEDLAINLNRIDKELVKVQGNPVRRGKK